MKIFFPDGSERKFKDRVTGMEIAQAIGPRLAKAALAIKANNDLLDLETPLKEDAHIEILTFDSKEGKNVFWHSSSHVLAEAIKSVYPKAKFAIGPAIDEGFYYDIDIEKTLTPEDMEKIERKYSDLLKNPSVFKRKFLSKKEAMGFYKDNEFKKELLEGIEDKEISFYGHGTFTDLCRGPHLASTEKIKAVKVLKIAGAYWRGDSKNKMLQRVYAITFPSQKQLDEYLKMKEEALKRDHKKLGKDLELFSLHDEAPGSPFFHPKGTVIYNELVNFAREQNTKRGYSEVITPMLLDESLWHTSGHWDNFKDNMYFTEFDERTFAVKPMNCPGGLLIYKSRLHSYRELPIRNAEFGYVYRHELSGVLNGLFRVRSFTQDDAHSFCTEQQLEGEISQMVDYAVDLYSTFGFKEYTIYIATKPENYIGDDSVWELATNALKNALIKKEMDFRIKEGEGAFYGPKIEFNIKDALNREWQCGTIQVDFSMPKRFEAEYEGNDGKRHTPVMVHRAILGSIERFMGILIEHFGGKFPLWISPVQIQVIPVSEKSMDYAKEIHRSLLEHGFRAEIDEREDTVSYKIRHAQNQKINYMLILGEKEKQDRTVSVRNRLGKQVNGMLLKDFIFKALEEIASKSLKLLVD